MSQTPRYLFSGLASLWMDGFSVSLSQMIPHVYDRLLDGSGFEYLQVCAFGTPLLYSPLKSETLFMTRHCAYYS